MTFAARKVLADCVVALGMLEEEQDLQKWRVIWVAAVALLRTVGHVLDKVDGEDANVKAVAGTLYKAWKGDDPAHKIFREFIERERNLILKEYQLNLHPLEEVPILVELKLASMEPGRPNVVTGYIDALDENMYRPLLDSPWEGDDARDVYEEALKWWNLQLDSIDKKVRRLRRKPSR